MESYGDGCSGTPGIHAEAATEGGASIKDQTNDAVVMDRGGDSGSGSSGSDHGAPSFCIHKHDVEYVQRSAMESLLRRALIAEAEVDYERGKARISEEEVKKKSIQIEEMWSRVEEMEKVAVGTSGILREMQLKLEDMEQETCRQRQRANENEQELSKVRRDFGVLKSSVDSLVKARETIRSMERRIEEVERISERLTARVGGLEAGKRDREAEIQKLILENDKLRAQLDFKEAELAAVSDQVKMMAKVASAADT